MDINNLKAQPRWLCHKTKVPRCAITGDVGKSNDPSTWGTYAQAVKMAKFKNLDGVGIVFTGDGLVGIDLDHAIGDNDGTTAKYAKHLLAMTRSYVEVSPSGRGLHIIGTGVIPRSIKQQLHGIGVEVYDTGRYFTWTGNEYCDDGEEADIASIQDVIDDIVDTADLATPSKAPPTPYKATGSTDPYVGAVWCRWRDHAVATLAAAVPGGRHNTRVKMARLLGGALSAVRAEGFDPLSDADAVTLLYDALTPDTGEETKELRAIEWGFAHGLSAPLVIPVALPPAMVSIDSLEAMFGQVPAVPTEVIPNNPHVIPTYHKTDVGNGQRFAHAVKNNVSYVAAWGQWVVWNGTHWAPSDGITIRKAAHAVIMEMYRGAAEGVALDHELAKWALKSENAARINAMVESAQPYLLTDVALFDTHHDHLNTQTGIVCLRTGKVTPHDRTWYFTKCINVDYDPKADRSVVDDFMRTITAGDIDLSQYIKRAVGYSATGRTDEHCLFFAYGNGKNGKSTFMNMVASVMGDYATTTSVEALLDVHAKGEGASPYMARLPGKRIAIAQEMPEGRRMNEALIKAITGGDRIATRGLYKDVFEFTPSHSLWVSGNHKPRITGTDDGIWRRLRILPFTVSIPESERRDSRVIEAEFYAHRAGILRWIVEGAMMWYKMGLSTCRAVDVATAEYRGEEDAVARFITEMCVLSPVASVDKKTLYAAWSLWAGDENDKVSIMKSQRWLILQFTQRYGCERGGQGRASIVGVKLQTTEADADNHRAPSDVRGGRLELRSMDMQ